MELTIADTYYLKAKEAMNGPCVDWIDVCESLNYALSYNENYCAVLCMLGEVYAKNLNQYAKAFDCFDRVIAISTDYLEVYPMYATYLIWADEIERAFKLINFGFTIKGIDKASLYCVSAFALETTENYKLSLKHLSEAKKNTYVNDEIFFIEAEESRIKRKLESDIP